MADHVATAETQINRPAAEVWVALTDPERIERYMFGSRVDTDWRPGSPIRWSGEYEGRSYEDKGEVVEVVPARLLKVTHFSPLSGQPDVPENYHTLTYELNAHGETTVVRLSQDNNPSEEAAEHSRVNWQRMLTGLKDVVEQG